MKTRGLPGTLAPRYHELQLGKSVSPASSFTCYAAARLVDPHREALAPQPVEHVQAGESAPTTAASYCADPAIS
jgi:hypothetical protein